MPYGLRRPCRPSKCDALVCWVYPKFENVISIEEVAAEAAPANTENANPYAKLFGIGGGPGAEDEYADGELTRKVRVRVKVSVTK